MVWDNEVNPSVSPIRKPAFSDSRLVFRSWGWQPAQVRRGCWWLVPGVCDSVCVFFPDLGWMVGWLVGLYKGWNANQLYREFRKNITRRWQLKYVFNFNVHPYLGKMNPFWRTYFSNGLVQPPTSLAWLQNLLIKKSPTCRNDPVWLYNTGMSCRYLVTRL